MNALEEWKKIEYTGMKPGLERIRRFIEKAGHPERRFRTVHIAGTNGKGSTAKMLSMMLTEAGYRTALYTSPHLVRLTERIQLNGKEIPAKRLELLSEKLAPLGRQCSLTFFEFMTAAAFVYFAEEKAEIAVLETGLGGRFDATNAVEDPLVSVITDIDYDHQKVLGRTLSDIAFEKAGIIRKKGIVVSGVARRQAETVIRNVAAERGARLIEAGRDFRYVPVKTDWKGGLQTVRFEGRELRGNFEVSLLGSYQAQNMAVALATAETLIEQGIHLAEPGMQRALKNVYWPGRFEIIDAGDGRRLIIDGAHNPGGMKKLIETLKKSPWGGKKRTFIFGVMNDKNYGRMIRIAAEAADRVIVVPVESSRAASVETLVGQWRKYLPESRILAARSYNEALGAVKGEKVTVITGSLYLAGDIIKTVKRGRHG
jgi:dihydrofolate synthase/folylpolyglutamate synthase